MKALLKLRELLANLLGVYVQQATEVEDAYLQLMRLWPEESPDGLVRAGGENDGGYLIPANQARWVQGVFSPGVSTVVDFELYFANRNIPCHLADGSIENLPIEHQNFRFKKAMVSSVTDSTRPSVSIADWVGESGLDSSELLLQMDIEGDEYVSLLATPDQIMKRFRVIVLELHDLNSMLTKQGLRLCTALFDKLLTHHFPVHLHVNNASAGIRVRGLRLPDTIEVTLLRVDAEKERTFRAASLPHPLDSPNTPMTDWTLDFRIFGNPD